MNTKIKLFKEAIDEEYQKFIDEIKNITNKHIGEKYNYSFLSKIERSSDITITLDNLFPKPDRNYNRGTIKFHYNSIKNVYETNFDEFGACSNKNRKLIYILITEIEEAWDKFNK